jgi:hypothetical protein
MLLAVVSISARDAWAISVPTVTVPATSDIFAADRTSVPAFPGGGGTLPPGLTVTPGSVITVSSSGQVDCGGGAPSGPDGSTGGGTVSIQSYRGISGADIPGGPVCGLALAGVFTGATPPANPAPSRLSFVTGPGRGFTTLEPALNQTFFIGDGLTATGSGNEQTFIVPQGATELWLGFQDGQSYTSPPGYYGDDTGSVSAKVTVLPTLPNIDAGTFVSFRYLPGGGEICTTGFGLMRAGVRYETAAKHCIDGTTGAQRNNKTIAAHQPMTITTSDAAFIFATSVNCSPPNPRSCLLPTVVSGVTGDMTAWEPDASVPSGKVQTSKGLLPVLGTKKWQKVAGQKICHYGYGSGTTGSAERCGTAFTARQVAQVCSSSGIDCEGAVPEPVYGAGGDSGGPVYVFNASKTGVYAVGVTVEAGSTCSGLAGKASCGELIEMVPINMLLTRLGATLLTSS